MKQLLIDVDGPLNPYAARPRSRGHGTHRMRRRLDGQASLRVG